MGILDDLGRHAELQKKLTADSEPINLFPVNTADDVYTDDDGNTLSDVLPMVEQHRDGSITDIGAMSIREDDVITIDNAELLNVLSGDYASIDQPEQPQET